MMMMMRTPTTTTVVGMDGEGKQRKTEPIPDGLC